MKMKKIISAFLAIVTLSGALAVQASATLPPINATEQGKELDYIDYAETVKQYLTSKNEFKTDAEKLATMTLRYEKDGYQLWADEFTGEVATVNLASGQVMFTNPRDIASSSAAHSNTTRYELMSQLVVKYSDNGTEKYFYSFEQAAMNGQISVTNIKNGLRVDYTIGREETKYLVPRMIEKKRMEDNILSIVAAEVAEANNATPEDVVPGLNYGAIPKPNPKFFDYVKVRSYYTLKDPNATTTQRELAEMQAQFEITKKEYNGALMAVYVCSAESGNELREVETRIKTYCPAYTYEQLEYDHELTEYSKQERPPALFKMALEYKLDSFGLSVRLPANGIRFNEAEYQLTDITVLPWMGAGSNDNTGYTFFPDGSGALFRFEDLNNKKTHTISGSIYGQDYAYHTVSGTHQEIIRYPVYGIVENRTLTVKTPEDETGGTTTTGSGSGSSSSGSGSTTTPETPAETTKKESRGFVAIVEEGDALTKLTLKHYGAVSKYNTIQVVVNPRPRDEYILSDAISVGSNSSVTVVSKRKYVGNYKIRYIMLTDETIAKEKNLTDTYEATWLGMATAYRAYLTSPYSTGTQNLPADQQTVILKRLTEKDVKTNVPLYLETFGAVETVKKVLSVPVNVKVALASFDNIQQMYTDLKKKGIDNVNFKLTGYYNGGMYSSVPYRLKFEKSVGGSDGFKKLIEDAKNRDYGVFVDFDFAYANAKAIKMFDGLSKSKDLVKSIDDRYTSKQYYSVTRQSYTSYFELAISPSRFSHFYDKLNEKYQTYNPIGISLSTLASSLNSDFDEDDPYNREDAKEFTVDLFKRIRNDYSNVLVSSANAFTWGYIDHMVNAAVDSSRYVKSSNAVPFLGVVLHGFVQFAGTPMNMEGDVGHAMLKAIENGSGLYFILSYQNTELLKEDEKLSQYYSVRYDIWFDELVERYTTVNEALKDLQTKLIIDHEFLIGERIPDDDEAKADAEAEKKRQEEEEKAKAEAERIEFINTVRKGRYDALTTSKTAFESAQRFYKAVFEGENAYMAKLKAAIQAIRDANLIEELATKSVEVAEAKKAYDDAVLEAGDEPTEEQKANLKALKKTYDDLNRAYVSLKNSKLIKNLKEANTPLQQIERLPSYQKNTKTALANAKVAYDELTNGKHAQAVADEMVAKYNQVVTYDHDIDAMVNAIVEAYKEYREEILALLPDQDYLKPFDTPDSSTPGTPSEDEDKPEEDPSYVYTKYTNDDGNIVAVTYGGKNGNDNEAYRTFILNYNFFDVKTTYNGVTYTIPAFGFIRIDY